MLCVLPLQRALCTTGWRWRLYISSLAAAQHTFWLCRQPSLSAAFAALFKLHYGTLHTLLPHPHTYPLVGLFMFLCTTALRRTEAARHFVSCFHWRAVRHRIPTYAAQRQGLGRWAPGAGVVFCSLVARVSWRSAFSHGTFLLRSPSRAGGRGGMPVRKAAVASGIHCLPRCGENVRRLPLLPPLLFSPPSFLLSLLLVPLVSFTINRVDACTACGMFVKTS